MLVNNVGMAQAGNPDIPSPVNEYRDQGIHNLVTCNMYGQTLLTREIAEGFKKRFEKTGKRSCITFTSAMAAISPVGIVALYSATKIFVDFLTWGLGYELKKFKVDVSSWRAMGVMTNMTEGMTENFMVATPERYV